MLWQFTTGGSVDSSPAVSNGLVYVGSFDANVYALNASTETSPFDTAGEESTDPPVVNCHSMAPVPAFRA